MRNVFVTVLDRNEYTATGPQNAREATQCQRSYLISSTFIYILKYEIKEIIATYCQHFYSALAKCLHFLMLKRGVL